MLHLLDATLEAYLRGEVPLNGDVDIAYEAPDSNWSARIMRPTINLFVWDIRKNTSESQGGMDLVERDADRFHRPTPPRIDFRYLITTWTAEVRDEHELLGALLVTCLRQPLIPERYLAGALGTVRPVPRLQVAKWDGAESSEFWSSMGGQLKAALDVIVSASVDTAVLRPAGPPVRSLGVASRPTAGSSRSGRTYEFPGTRTNGGAGGPGAPDGRSE